MTVQASTTERGAAAEPIRTSRAQTPSARSSIGTLESLRAQTGNLIGELYARAAGTLLKRLEAIEDREAQRRFRRRSKPASPSSSVSSGGTSETESRPFTRHTSA